MILKDLVQIAGGCGISVKRTDLAGLNGLWMPGSRLILIEQQLTDDQAVEVLQHEMEHAQCDDAARARHRVIDGNCHPRSAPTIVAGPSRRRRALTALSVCSLLAVLASLLAFSTPGRLENGEPPLGSTTIDDKADDPVGDRAHGPAPTIERTARTARQTDRPAATPSPTSPRPAPSSRTSTDRAAPTGTAPAPSTAPPAAAAPSSPASPPASSPPPQDQTPVPSPSPTPVRGILCRVVRC